MKCINDNEKSIEQISLIDNIKATFINAHNEYNIDLVNYAGKVWIGLYDEEWEHVANFDINTPPSTLITVCRLMDKYYKLGFEVGQNDVANSIKKLLKIPLNLQSDQI